jgi:hypothetical protein
MKKHKESTTCQGQKNNCYITKDKDPIKMKNNDYLLFLTRCKNMRGKGSARIKNPRRKT